MQSSILCQPQACRAHPARRGASRPCRRVAVVKASSETEAYVPPSYRTAATELSALQRFSEVVPDVLLSQTLQKVEAPRAATASRSVLGGIIGNPSAPARYKIAIEQAKYFDRCLPYSGEDQTACQIDKALVNLGSLFLEKVEGRVSTEVDPKVARDTEKLIMRGQNLIELYEEVGVSRDRVLLRIPATWEGVQAAKALEAQKITTHLVLVYSFAQGAAAAQAGVSVIQPNVGRLHDWYNRHPGYVRDPKLCRGASSYERQAYCLPESPDTFSYLSSSGCTTIPGVNDALEFVEVKEAMASVGITEEKQRNIFSTLAAILWLGNITFVPLSEDAVDVAQSCAEAITNAATLLRCPEQALVTALTKRKLLVGGEHITRDMNMDAALDNRDALSKALYAELFDWLVEQVNAALAVGKQRSETSLSILDIYGFECFKQNSFEQLCINYANERLQQQFNKHLFKLEQTMYESENIDWTHVEFEDNQECVDLIEARPPLGVGILSLLDEECIYPRGTDSSFAIKLRQRQKMHPRFSFNPKIPTDDFTLHHYAGPVVYSCNKILDKNKDTLSPDLVQLLQGSHGPLVKTLAVEMSAGQDKKGSQTVGARFREQLRDLIQRLDVTSLHFIRCIKPNSQQVPSYFDPALVLHQLKCCGVLEVTRIARAGYPTRYRHEDFAERYKVLLPELSSGAPQGTPALSLCKRLLQHFNVDPAMYQVGCTKLFFRAGVLGQLEDTWARIQRSVLYIQSMFHMAKARRAFMELRQAAVTMQSMWRSRQARLLFASMMQQKQAATRLQAAFRGHLQRQRFLRAKVAATRIQMAWRWLQVKQRVAARFELRRQFEEEQQAMMEARRREEESYEAVHREFGMDGGEIREVLSLWQRHGHQFMHWLEQQENADLAAAAAAADQGQQASELQQQVCMLEAYSLKLERQLADLSEENGLLQHAVETLQQQHVTPVREHCQQVIANAISPVKRATQAPGSSAGKPPRAPVHNVHALPESLLLPDDDRMQRRRSSGSRHLASDEDDISLMSLSDDDSSFSRGGTPKTTSLTFDGRTPLSSVQGHSSAIEEGQAALLSLDKEFEKKRALFDDDADFIREVREGVSEAPGMNPEVELKRLIQRYKVWKKNFKSRITATQQVVKHSAKREHSSRSMRDSLQGSGSTPLSGSKSVLGSSDGSLTARLFKLKGSR